MAKLTVTVLLFILALAQGGIPLDIPENEVTTQDFPTNEQESDQKTAAPTFLLPSEKLGSELEAVEVAKPENYESEIQESESNDFVPLTVINFQPINRHFPRQPSLTLRHRRPCRHHRVGRSWGPARSHHGEVSYGNDMLISSGNNKAVKVVRHSPPRWGKFYHGDTNGPRFPYWSDDDLAKGEGFKRPRYHHRNFHHHHADEEDIEREGREHKTGFLMKIRKLLNQF